MQVRWPRAFVVDHDGSYRFTFTAHLGLEAGIHQELFEEFIYRVMQGVFQLWQQLTVAATSAEPPTQPRRRRRRPTTAD